MVSGTCSPTCTVKMALSGQTICQACRLHIVRSSRRDKRGATAGPRRKLGKWWNSGRRCPSRVIESDGGEGTGRSVPSSTDSTHAAAVFAALLLDTPTISSLCFIGASAKRIFLRHAAACAPAAALPTRVARLRSRSHQRGCMSGCISGCTNPLLRRPLQTAICGRTCRHHKKDVVDDVLQLTDGEAGHWRRHQCRRLHSCGLPARFVRLTARAD